MQIVQPSTSKRTVVLSGEMLRSTKPTFPEVCVVCGRVCKSEYISLKAWSGNAFLFGELAPTLSFEIPAHTSGDGCARVLTKRWKRIAYLPVFIDSAIIVICAPIAMYSLPLSLGGGAVLLAASSAFKVYLRFYSSITFKITQVADKFSTNYEFVFSDIGLAESFSHLNSELLAGD